MHHPKADIEKERRRKGPASYWSDIKSRDN
jgi:hypothetical protein